MSGREHISGIEVVRLDEVASTNDAVRALAEERRTHAPLLVTARHQHAGRGRGGNRWLSSPGDDLLLSLLWYPAALPAAGQFVLSMAAALATAQLVGAFTSGTAVKWPNDILTGGKKIAGILIENIIRGDRLDATIIGIGVNINGTSFPATLPTAVSLRMVTGRRYDPAPLLETLTGRLLHHLQRADNGEEEALRSEYEEHLYRRGEESLFRTARGTMQAVITGVDRQGRLLLKEKGKESHAFGMDEVHQLL